MIRIADILDIVTQHAPDADVDVVKKAYIYSARVHSGQIRLSGEPYLSHPLEVAGILTKMKLDTVSISSGLLHDVVEDTYATEEDIGETFGPSVRHIVSGVTKLNKLTFDSSKAREAESFRKMLLAMSYDIRVILIKLADRLHNMQTLEFHRSEAKKKEIARETLNIYAPIAARLGIYWIKSQLEDISLKYLNNEEYENIRYLISQDKKNREDYVRTIKDSIGDVLGANNLDFRTLGRYKNIYSISQKMRKQKISFDSVHDVIAFRIILKTTEDCYNTLGCIHGRWKPVPERIKDYIGMPKSNMYQSIHTTVIGPSGKRIEIQIRTEQMDEVAQSGIAAHWGYKEGKIIDKESSEAFKWLQDMVENQKYIKDPDELLETFRVDLFPDEVYVFTPDGNIKTLPRGATPVDFAYSVHSEVGNQCIGCKVNGRMVPLKYELKNGEVVEIIISKGHNPSKDWLGFVKTVKAKSRIRQWIKVQDREISLSIGYEMCERAFNKNKLDFDSIIKQENTKIVVENLGFTNIDNLMVAIGYGKITPQQLMSKVTSKKDIDQGSLLDRIIKKVSRKKDKAGLIIGGHADMLIRFGKCCQPIPGDSVIGYITRGHGITVHRTICLSIVKMNPERQIDVEWNKTIGETYPVNIVISSMDRVGLLADIAKSISKSGVNIIDAKIQALDNGTANCHFTISVEDIKHLTQLIILLKKVKKTNTVRRVNQGTLMT